MNRKIEKRYKVKDKSGKFLQSKVESWESAINKQLAKTKKCLKIRKKVIRSRFDFPLDKKKGCRAAA